MPGDLSDESKGQIPTNLRLLLLMEQIAQDGAPVSPGVLSAKLGLPKPTIHRLLATAEEECFLQRDLDGRSFGRGSRLRKLAANTLSSQRVRTERLMVLKKLAEDLGETCNLAAPGRYGMVYLDRVETHWPLRIQLPVGTQVPFHCTASGKMYLSSMRPEKLKRLLQSMPLEKKTARSIVTPKQLMSEIAVTRARGYSNDDQEFMDGMAAVAIPICDDRGRLLTMLSIHAPIQRHDLDDLTQSIDILRAGAKRMEEIVS